MIIKELLSGIPYSVLQGSDEIDIPNISWDSRRVQPNSLFICVISKNVDRHDFAYEAIQKGARVLIVERTLAHIPSYITMIKVRDSRKAMASIANLYYGEPSKKLNLIGITGTNGKTSVSVYIGKILEKLGRKTGVIGTIKNYMGDRTLKTEKLNPTTPDSMELQSSLNEMIHSGVSDAMVEVTSSALSWNRVDYCDFDIGIFTNLTRDHLDEHGTMENYKKAKLKLFNMCRLGIVNSDDAFTDEIVKHATCEIITYGITKNSDFMAQDIHHTREGITYTLCFCETKRTIRLNALGKFNIYNSLAAIAACYFLGIPLDVIVDGIGKITGVQGRFEHITVPKNYSVIIDYAHTPDGLMNVLLSARELTNKKIYLVFGCGGNRDRTKRPIMGKIAGNLGDYCIITSDNPRTENPVKIIEDIEKGIKQTNCIYDKIQNRKTAIESALKLANKGDIVVIAGKGHEAYQLIDKTKYPFSDKETVMNFFEVSSSVSAL